MATKSIRLSDGTDTLLPECAVSGTYSCKMADGTLMQWGVAGAYTSANRSNVQVTMPIAYTDTNYIIVASGEFSSDENNYEVTCTTRVDNTTKFTIHIRNNSANYIRQFKWFTVGRWK